MGIKELIQHIGSKSFGLSADRLKPLLHQLSPMLQGLAYGSVRHTL